jgi:hypothetical protein
MWHRFVECVHALQRHDGTRPGRFIGVRHRPSAPSVLFRLERRDPDTRVVALTVAPDFSASGDRLVLRVHTVVIVGGSLSALPTCAVPVSYDLELDSYSFGTPAVNEDEAAQFFVKRAEDLLGSLSRRDVREAAVSTGPLDETASELMPSDLMPS